MQATRTNIAANLWVLGFLSIALSSCSGDDGGSPGTAGNSPGGATSGGASPVGGAPAGGGAATNGGSPATGGKGDFSGGGPATGQAGKGGESTAGRAGGGGTGGTQGGMGTGGAGGIGSQGGTGGATAGAGGGPATGNCVKGTKGSEVAVIGDSFIAIAHGLTHEIENNAKTAGALAQSEKYVDTSVSGTTLAGAIPGQYDQAVQSSGTIKYVIMDGGGNDCMGGGNGDAAIQAATKLFANMATKGTLRVEYIFYPDPMGSFASGGLKTCLDALRPKMKTLCEGLTAPKCYFFDLRPIWNGHSEYTSDGIHPTAAGDKATGAAVWADMVKNCVAQ